MGEGGEQGWGDKGRAVEKTGKTTEKEDEELFKMGKRQIVKAGRKKK